MNVEQNIIDTNIPQDIQDDSGLVEIQQGIDEIERLKNEQSEEEQEASAEIEEKTINDDEAEEEIPRKKEKKEDKAWKLKKDKYRAIAEKEAALQKNAELERMLNEALNSGTYHFSKNAYLDFKEAKEAKKRAIEAGDIDALIEADISLTKATNKVDDLEKWVANEEQKKSRAYEAFQEQSPQIDANLANEMAADWLDNHIELQPSSQHYNQKLANKVAKFINNLDQNLAKNNEMDAYYSEEYFETIDKYISEARNESQKITKSLEAASHIGGVRKSSPSSGNGKSLGSNQIVLTSDEKRMAYNAGLTEKEWLIQKLEDLKLGNLKTR